MKHPLSLTTMDQIIHEDKETTLDKLAIIQYIDKYGSYNIIFYNVLRFGINNKSKISSYGFLATFLNCLVVVEFTEQLCSEGSEFEDFIYIFYYYITSFFLK